MLSLAVAYHSGFAWGRFMVGFLRILNVCHCMRSTSSMKSRFLPKSQIGRDVLLLVVLIVPLVIAGVIWGIYGDFSDEIEPVTPTPATQPATPQASPAAWLRFVAA